ncbi:hypothetical protein GGI10_004077 [Coemansia sp. RSA 2530]|nr:hypothetical protein GGI06_000848 [Coemansia sp. S85]KAJ2411770.1 hypothetical protein GGI10_004077 [Coemansia sp. RSA 2530]
MERDGDLEDVIYRVAAKHISKASALRRRAIRFLKTNQLSHTHVLLGGLSPKWPSRVALLGRTVAKTTVLLGNQAPAQVVSELEPLLTRQFRTDSLEIKRLVNSLIRAVRKEAARQAKFEKDRHIRGAIIRQQDMLSKGPGRVGQAVLDKRKGAHGISRVIGTDAQGELTVPTEPDKVRELTRAHFDDMFRPRPVRPELLTEWAEEYAPKGRPEQYPATVAEASIEEVGQLLKESPRNKAAGPSGVTFELLRVIPGIECVLATMFADILKGEKEIPSEWTSGSMSADADGVLAEQRPITLLPVVRKLFTALLTRRLTVDNQLRAGGS